MNRPTLSSHWDNRRQAMTYKVAIDGTSKFLLFTDETLRDLHEQITEATKGTDDDRSDRA